jgi:hypothetical protein
MMASETSGAMNVAIWPSAGSGSSGRPPDRRTSHCGAAKRLRRRLRRPSSLHPTGNADTRRVWLRRQALLSSLQNRGAKQGLLNIKCHRHLRRREDVAFCSDCWRDVRQGRMIPMDSRSANSSPPAKPGTSLVPGFAGMTGNALVKMTSAGSPYILISAASTMASAISRMDLRSFMLFC